MDYIFKSSYRNQCFQGKLHQIASLAVKSSSCIFLILLLLINNLPVQSQRHKGRNFNGAALSALIDISKGYSASSPPLDGTSLSASIIGGDLRRNTVLKEIPSPALGLNDIINQAENTVRRRIEELEPSILSSDSTRLTLHSEVSATINPSSLPQAVPALFQSLVTQCLHDVKIFKSQPI